MDSNLTSHSQKSMIVKIFDYTHIEHPKVKK